MATEILVDARFDSGQQLLNQLGRDGFDVSVAFWARAQGEETWYLYIAADAVDPGDVGGAFGTLYTSLRKLPDRSVALSEIKMVPTSHPAAQAALALRDRHLGRIPIRFRGSHLGNLAIGEEAYIYPAVGVMTTREVLQTVAELMDHPGPIPPSLVTFTDGTTMQAVPVGLNKPPGSNVQVVLQDVSSGKSTEVPVEEVLNIQTP